MKSKPTLSIVGAMVVCHWKSHLQVLVASMTIFDFGIVAVVVLVVAGTHAFLPLDHFYFLCLMCSLSLNNDVEGRVHDGQHVFESFLCWRMNYVES